MEEELVECVGGPHDGRWIKGPELSENYVPGLSIPIKPIKPCYHSQYYMKDEEGEVIYTNRFAFYLYVERENQAAIFKFLKIIEAANAIELQHVLRNLEGFK